MLRARVAMRLKEHQEPLIIASARGRKGGANFRGMMAVVIDQSDAMERAFNFEAPPDAGKFREARADQVGRNIQRERDGGGSGGITHVVNSRRRREMEYAQFLAVIFQPEFAGQAAQLHLAD